MTNTLYELSNEILDLMSKRERSQEDDQERSDWILSFDFELQLDQILVQFQDKVENVCKFIRNLEVSSDWLANEAQRLLALKKQNDNKVDRLKSYLEVIMKAQGLEKYDAWLFKLSLRPSERMKVSEDGIQLLPVSLLRYSINQDIDLSLKWQLDEMGIATSTMPVWLPDIKKRYKALTPEDQETLKGKIYIENVQSLQLK